MQGSGIKQQVSLILKLTGSAQSGCYQNLLRSYCWWTRPNTMHCPWQGVHHNSDSWGYLSFLSINSVSSRGVSIEIDLLEYTWRAHYKRWQVAFPSTESHRLKINLCALIHKVWDFRFVVYILGLWFRCLGEVQKPISASTSYYSLTKNAYYVPRCHKFRNRLSSGNRFTTNPRSQFPCMET